ncbi:MAG: ABC transporter ATP-binding protein, partial [Deltaproteobacteria bacterium]|nr:ABC transporter ATP-binding protein [Deltaproteobacteria bacterium]
RELIRSLASGGQHTIILSTHILQEVVSTCQRIVMISKGKIAADAPIGELTEQHRMSLEEVFIKLANA